MNLYEKLNRLDDSLVESRRVVKKKKLTESVEDEDYDDDIDEMLTEDEVTSREKLMKTFPDDFGHWSRRPANKTSAQHKTMNDYARDPNTPTYDNKGVTTSPTMSTRDKLLKTFPDLDIRSSKDFLKEAVKDTDYVIAYVHPVSTFSKRYTFLGSNYRMTKDLDKAMTYTSKFSAEDEIKYAKDEVERIVDNSTPTGYASNFAADSDRFLVITVAKARELLKNPDKKVSRAVSNNSEAQKAAKPVATEIHSIIKKYDVSLSSFLMLIKELIKAEDPEA